MRSKRIREGAATEADLQAYLRKGKLAPVLRVASYPTLTDETFRQAMNVITALSYPVSRVDAHRRQALEAFLLRSDVRASWFKLVGAAKYYKIDAFEVLMENPHIEKSTLLSAISDCIQRTEIHDNLIEGVAKSTFLTADLAYLIYNKMALRASEDLREGHTGWPSERSLRNLAENPNTPSPLLGRLASSTIREVAQLASVNPSFLKENALGVQLRFLPPELLKSYTKEFSQEQMSILTDLPKTGTLEDALDLLNDKSKYLKGAALRRIENPALEASKLKNQEDSPWVIFLLQAQERFNNSTHLTQTLASHLKVTASPDVVTSLEDASSETFKLLNFYESLLDASGTPQTIRALSAVKEELEKGLNNYEEVVEALLNLNDGNDQEKARDALEVVLAQVKGWAEVREVANHPQFQLASSSR